MGAINYKTSDYITIGYNCNNIDYEDEFYHEIIQDDFDEIARVRARYYFYYFCVTIEPGYYEGFHIEIEHNFSCCYDSSEDKKLAQKEITQLKKFLLECINDFGLCAVYPGWCTGCADYNETLKDLSAAIKEMRETVKTTPTYNQYFKAS